MGVEFEKRETKSKAALYRITYHDKVAKLFGGRFYDRSFVVLEREEAAVQVVSRRPSYVV